MLPRAHISHRAGRRLRLKIPSMKGDTGFFDEVGEHLRALGGVEFIKTNALTGSVFLRYGGDAVSIAEHAAENGLFELAEAGRRPRVFSEQVVKGFRGVDTKIKSFSGGELDVPGVAFLALLGLGGVQIGRGNFMAPAWYTAFWYALNIFLKGLPPSQE